MSFCRSQDELTLLQLRRAVLVIADLSGEIEHPGNICEHYYSLMTQYRDIHWVFMVGSTCFPLAVQLLMRPESTLISDSEPVKRLIEVVRAGGLAAERISQTLFSPEVERIGEEQQKMVILTLSERKVLRLLAKGWGINQIAALLKKSNKTISFSLKIFLRLFFPFQGTAGPVLKVCSFSMRSRVIAPKRKELSWLMMKRKCVWLAI